MNGLPSGTALAYYNPKNTIHEDFGTVRADYNLRDQDRLSVSYMIDTGNSVIPLADPLFASGLRLGAQVASVEETHVVSPAILNTFRVGFSRGAFNYDAASYATVSPESVVCRRRPAGSDHHQRRRYHRGRRERERRRVGSPQPVYLYG